MKKDADALRAQVNTINRKMAAIEDLMVKRFSWAKKLNDLADSLTSGIWLTALTYDERETERQIPAVSRQSGAMTPGQPAQSQTERVVLRYLIISGYAATTAGEEGTAAVGRFIKALKDNQNFYADFSDIELGAIKRDKVEEQEVMSFRLTCLFKETK